LAPHGLMDEAVFLEEGQIYCSVMVDGKSQAIIGKDLIVTREPALHPGDVQLAEGVMPSSDSPLLALSKCVCFSQKAPKICQVSSAEVILMEIRTTSSGTRIVDPRDTLLLQTIHVRSQMSSTDLWRGMT